MNRKNLDNFITDALFIEARDAKEAGALGYMARALTQATMPHSAKKGTEFKRENGAFRMYMLAPSETGLPYGSYPRLLLAWMTTEAVRTKDHHLELGPTLSGFMAELNLLPRGGRWGTISRLRDQMNRLFCCSVSARYNDENRDGGLAYTIAKNYDLWWNPKRPDQGVLWNSTVTLSRDFFDEIIDRPVPVDMDALKLLKKSPMALDAYCWLTYRMSYLNKTTLIPWQALQLQFGSEYADTPQGRQGFRRGFERAMQKVCVAYPQARLYSLDEGLELQPSPPHVKKLDSLRKLARKS